MGQDPYKYFRVEAKELVTELSRGVLDLEKARTPELARKLLRFAHTLKGAARVVKQAAIAEQAHAIEEALSPLRDDDRVVPPDHVERVLRILDEISARVRGLDAPEEPAGNDDRSSPSVDDSFGIARFDASEIDSLLEGVAEASVKLRAVRSAAAALDGARRVADLLADQSLVSSAREPAQIAAAVARARALADDLRGNLAVLGRQFDDNVDQVERELEQIQQVAERLRLVPASAVFASLARTVFDVSKALGKRASFDGTGGDVRLDADVLATLQGALIQLARNAVAHGIETPAERSLAGKPPVGRVELEIRRAGSRIVFICRDDGRGIDVGAVRAAAERRGVSFGAAEPTAEELVRLLLRGGLTTSATVTEVSGRGIGLDVVREAVARLSGVVNVRTEKSKGTEVEIRVPVSLSSLDALLVEAGGVAAAIPLDAVRRTLRIVPGDLARAGDSDAVIHEGEAIRFVPLFQGAEAKSKVTKNRSAVVIRGKTALAAVGVDRLVGTANVVVRPLPELAVAERWISGASLDAEGTPRLVLDPDAFVAMAEGDRGATRSAGVAEKSCILVIDDSLTTRMLEQTILESAGYEVDLATSAEEALEKAQKRRYGLFLVDVEMPGMDGFSFVERTRADPAQRDTPAILVSSRSAPEDLRRGRDAGAAAYVVKSEFDQIRLLDTIAKLLRAS